MGTFVDLFRLKRTTYADEHAHFVNLTRHIPRLNSPAEIMLLRLICMRSSVLLFVSHSLVLIRTVLSFSVVVLIRGRRRSGFGASQSFHIEDFSECHPAAQLLSCLLHMHQKFYYLILFQRKKMK
jgi:hypothetical protein